MTLVDLNQILNSLSSIANFSVPNHTHNKKAVIAALQCALMHHKEQHPERKTIQIEHYQNMTTLFHCFGRWGGSL